MHNVASYFSFSRRLIFEGARQIPNNFIGIYRLSRNPLTLKILEILSIRASVSL